MSTTIHSTAIISAEAQIGNNVHIGPYCVIGSGARIADDVHIASHVVIDGHTTIGARTQIFPFASLGQVPPDRKYQGEQSELVIGTDNVIREYVTMNPGTQVGRMRTEVGNNCLILVSAHVAHDCVVGNNVVMSNHATLGGHVEVGDFATLGGLAAVHQHVRIGAHAMIGGMSGIERDVIPYGMAVGERASLIGLNLVGLKRRGFNRESINALRDAYHKIFYAEDNAVLVDLIKQLKSEYSDEAVLSMLEFLEQDTSRTLCRPRVTK